MTASARDWAASVAVQALGAAATLATGLLIAGVFGPQAQGRYGLVRSTADVFLALALFGLPQSMVQAVHRQGVSAAGLERAAVRYGGGMLLSWIGVALLLAIAPIPWPPWLDGPIALAALGVGVCGWLVQGLWRALVLCRGGALLFAWSSLLPALTLLVATAFLLAAGSVRFEWALAASGIASVALANVQLRRLRHHEDWGPGAPAQLSRLARSGALAMAQTLALALQPWLTLLLLRRFDADTEQLGYFVFAALVQQLFALPASFLSPLVLARISREPDAGGRAVVRRGVPLLAGAVAAACIAAALVPWAVPRAFGAAYDAAVPACIWMALGGPFVIASRLAVSVLLGQGAFRASAWHAGVRAFATVGCVTAALAAPVAQPATAAAIAWVAVEALSLAAAIGWLTLGNERAGR
ncbi:MAG: hypothetical protein ABIX12_00625, partial [Rubrivivax sp.]